MMHEFSLRARFQVTAFFLLFGLVVVVCESAAHAQPGCEYVQTGATPGDFILDCGPHSSNGKLPDPNPDRYLSIALSPKNMAAGIASGSAREATKQNALAQCAKNGGIGCLVVESYLNMCAAIAVSSPRKIIAVEEMPGQGWNPSELARRKCAMSGGSNCSTIVAGCANGYMSPKPWLPPTNGDGSFQMPVFRRR